MLEESDPTFNNGETLTQLFVNYTILPLCQRIQDEMDYKLFSEEEQYTKRLSFNLTELLGADTEQRAKYLDTLMKWGIVTINEARAMERINPNDDPEANVHHIPVNMIDQVRHHKTALAMSHNKEIEKRIFQIQYRVADESTRTRRIKAESRTVEGYAALFNVTADIGGWFEERIGRGFQGGIETQRHSRPVQPRP